MCEFNIQDNLGHQDQTKKVLIRRIKARRVALRRDKSIPKGSDLKKRMRLPCLAFLELRRRTALSDHPVG